MIVGLARLLKEVFGQELIFALTTAARGDEAGARPVLQCRLRHVGHFRARLCIDPLLRGFRSDDEAAVATRHGFEHGEECRLSGLVGFLWAIWHGSELKEFLLVGNWIDGAVSIYDFTVGSLAAAAHALAGDLVIDTVMGNQ